ncbi:MAG: amidohydrolase family protein [Deltaproteobacteria bacterium]|nr:amidohydrolase family protein [Deltaproteobacteria bacterium]
MEVTKISEMSFENSKIVGREMIKGLRRAYTEGIVLGVGTDASVPYVPHYEFWKEVAYMLHYADMSPQLAIYMATLGNAQALEIAAETGSIEAGKSADLQVVSGNPLDDINVLGSVSKVLIRGHLIDKPRVKRIKTLDKSPIPEILEVPDE